MSRCWLVALLELVRLQSLSIGTLGCLSTYLNSQLPLQGSTAGVAAQAHCIARFSPLSVSEWRLRRDRELEHVYCSS